MHVLFELGLLTAQTEGIDCQEQVCKGSLDEASSRGTCAGGGLLSWFSCLLIKPDIRFCIHEGTG